MLPDLMLAGECIVVWIRFKFRGLAVDRFSKIIRGFDNGVIDIQVFTDGSCYPNPGIFGSWAYIIKYKDDNPSYKCSGRIVGTSTNNVAELTAAIQGLRFIKELCALELVTDSEYVGKGITSWMDGWMRYGFKNKNGDLWRQLYFLCNFHDVYVTCIRGHQGQPENEECDRLASEAANGGLCG